MTGVMLAAGVFTMGFGCGMVTVWAMCWWYTR